MTNQQTSAVPVKYVGRRQTYVEGAYGSKLVFTSDETKLVPPDLAAKLLRHPDVYVQGEMPKAKNQAVESGKKAPEEDNQESMLQDLRDTIAIMDKDALEQFGRFHFKVDIDKRRSLPNLRQEITRLLDQYGVAP